MSKFPSILAPMLALALACTASGCSEMTPRLDRQFGDSVRAATALQTRAPDLAARQRATEQGADGRAGVAAYERYQDSLLAPPAPAAAPIIGLGKR
ncbi:hypothetical protein [Janthinobacterium sp. RT4P48]|uniref:hypothetical protein n=1 Tax=Janthinobacterium sp. RT4P48 TaxID=3424188 RepID=UPI003F23D6CC